MTDETRSKLNALSYQQVNSLFWFLSGWFGEKKEFETACKVWLENHGVAREKCLSTAPPETGASRQS